MVKQKVTLSIDSEIYGEYKRLCDERGIIISKQVEILMKKQCESHFKEKLGD